MVCAPREEGEIDARLGEVKESLGRTGISSTDDLPPQLRSQEMDLQWDNPNETIDECLGTYVELMEEIKLRHITALRTLSQGTRSFTERDPKHPLSHAPPFLHIEIAYLNLRKICEIIALASLLAHGDFPGSRSKTLRKSWRAPEIMAELGKLNPDFYPIPIDQHHNDQGETIGFSIKEEGYLTRDEASNLWNICGDYLHRGSLSKIRDPDYQKWDSRDILDYLNKISSLLEIHRIPILSSKYHLRVVMWSRQRDGAAVVQLIEGDARTSL
jgi:hypothetical protein